MNVHQLSNNSTCRLRLLIVLDSGSWAERILDPINIEEVESIVPDLIEVALSNNLPIKPRTDSYAIPFRGLEIYDLRYDRMTEADREEIFSENIDRLHVGGVVQPLGIWLNENASFRYFVSSNQSANHERSTRFTLRCEAMLTGNSKTADSIQVSSRRIADVGSRPVGAELLNRLKTQSQKHPFPKEKVPYILEPIVVAEIIRSILPAFDGDLLRDNRSFLCGKQGKKIGSDILHMVDNASLPNGIATRSFDGYGVPSKLLTLIREGVFQDNYISTNHAQNTNQRPTGHYDLASQLMCGNISIKEGRRSRNMIASDIGAYLCLTQIKDPVSVNIQTGDVSFSAHASFVEGEDVKYVGAVKLQCTIFDLLGSVNEIASDHTRHEEVDTSSWVICDLPFKSV
jgi:predicted Zn-dependent protease